MIIQQIHRMILFVAMVLTAGCEDASKPQPETFRLEIFLATDSLVKTVSEELLLQPYWGDIDAHELEFVSQRWVRVRRSTDEALKRVNTMLADNAASLRKDPSETLADFALSIQLMYDNYRDALAKPRVAGVYDRTLDAQFKLHRFADYVITLQDEVLNRLSARVPEEVGAASVLTKIQLERAIQANKVGFVILRSGQLNATDMFLGARAMGQIDIYWNLTKRFIAENWSQNELEDQPVLANEGDDLYTDTEPFLVFMATVRGGDSGGTAETYMESPSLFYEKVLAEHDRIEKIKQVFIDRIQ